MSSFIINYCKKKKNSTDNITVSRKIYNNKNCKRLEYRRAATSKRQQEKSRIHRKLSYIYLFFALFLFQKEKYWFIEINYSWNATTRRKHHIFADLARFGSSSNTKKNPDKYNVYLSWFFFHFSLSDPETFNYFMYQLYNWIKSRRIECFILHIFIAISRLWNIVVVDVKMCIWCASCIFNSRKYFDLFSLSVLLREIAWKRLN